MSALRRIVVVLVGLTLGMSTPARAVELVGSDISTDRVLSARAIDEMERLAPVIGAAVAGAAVAGADGAMAELQTFGAAAAQPGAGNGPRDRSATDPLASLNPE